MGKVVKTIVGVGLAIVGVVTGNPWLIVTGLGIALSDQLVPEIPDATGNEATGGRLGRGVDPEARRKIVFGQTLAGMDQRYWEETNAEEAYHEVIALATHKIQSVGTFYIDGQACSFDGSGNITSPSQYVVPNLSILSGGGLTLTSVLKRRTVLEGTASNGIAVGSGSYWTSSQSTFTGCAYTVLSWVYDEDGLPRGIPQKIKQEVEGALVYDPRKDSTRGGSGSHRADDQTTWEYAPLDSNGVPIGRNNALQVLWYVIGWRIEGVRVAGMGVDLDDIDFASFIEAANNCETMEWYSDGILSTGDQHKKNLGILSSAAGGVVTDTGGIYNYRVAIDDTADIVVAFDENDIISEITGSPRRPMSEQFNEVAATFVDPRLGYQKAPLPLMDDPTYTADDGFTRRKSMSLDMVQDSEQGQKLTRLYLNKGRMQAEFTATFTRKAGRVVNMDCITITFADWGWTNRLFRVTQTTYDPNGGITLTFREEDASVYSFGTVTPLPAPATLPGGNPHAKYSVGSLSASPTTFTAETSGAASGQITDGVIISYDRPNQQVVQTQFRLRKITATSPSVSSETNWELLPPVSNDKEAPTLNITSLLSLTDYGMQARHINKNGVKGDWQAEVTFTTGGDAVAIKAVEAADPTLRRRTEWLTAATYNAIRDPLFKLGPGELWQKDDTTTTAFLDIDELDSDNRRLRVEVEGAKTVNLIYDRRMPVTEGDRVEFSGEFDRETTGVVTATANIDWYNSSGTLLSTSSLGGLVASYAQDGGFADAPANAHRCALRISITTTGDGAFVMRKPFWRIADPGQTVFTEFDEGQAEDIAEILSVRQVQAQQASLSQLIEVADADKSARIDTEVQARIDGDAAEATARTALEARVTTAENDISVNEAAITTEQAARASADSAIASDVTALEARVTTAEGGITTNAAAITSEASARASADSAIASDVTALDARVTSNEGSITTNAAAITSEASARATADSAIASDVTALTARVTTNEGDISTNAAGITSEATARASADSSLASDIATVSAVADAKNRVFYQTTAPTAEATGDLWFDTNDNFHPYRWSGSAWQSVRDGEIGVNAAAITSEASARATADSALASDITNLTATVGTNTSGVSTNAGAIADIEGAAAYYSVEVAATGSTNAGAYLTAGETGSRVDLIADKLLFLNYDGTGGVIEAMRIEGGNVKIKQDLQLDSTNGAVSQTFGASGEARFGSLGSSKYGMLIKDGSGNTRIRADQDGVTVNGSVLVSETVGGSAITIGDVAEQYLHIDSLHDWYTTTSPSGDWRGAANFEGFGHSATSFDVADGDRFEVELTYDNVAVFNAYEQFTFHDRIFMSVTYADGSTLTRYPDSYTKERYALAANNVGAPPGTAGSTQITDNFQHRKILNVDTSVLPWVRNGSPAVSVVFQFSIDAYNFGSTNRAIHGGTNSETYVRNSSKLEDIVMSVRRVKQGPIDNV